MIKVGIVGNGNHIGIARAHIKAFGLLEDVQISGLYDIIPGRSKAYKEELGLNDAKVCNSYEELLEAVDAVSICTPNFTHVDLSIRAIQAGKHVLCEKPFANYAKDCEEAVKYSKVNDKVCMLGLCYRYIPAVMYIKQLIEDGKLGEIYYVRQSLGGNRIASPDVQLEWRMQEDLSGPGAVADFGSHMLDIGDLLTREVSGKIVEVSCMEHTFIKERQVINRELNGPVTNDDVAVFTAKTEKGTLLSYTASRIGGAHTLEVYGSGGNISFKGETPFEVTYQEKDRNGAYAPNKETIEVPKELYMIDENVPLKPFEVNFYLQAKEFVQAIKDGHKVVSDFEHGVYIQKLIDALQISADTGSKVYLND